MMVNNSSRTSITISSQQEVSTTMPMVEAISIMINRTTMLSNNQKELVHLTFLDWFFRLSVRIKAKFNIDRKSVV